MVQEGYQVGKNRVVRRMCEMNMRGRPKHLSVSTTFSDANACRSEDLVRRQFVDLFISALISGILRCQPGKGLIVHSDHGSQYTSQDFEISWPRTDLSNQWVAWVVTMTTALRNHGLCTSNEKR